MDVKVPTVRALDADVTEYVKFYGLSAHRSTFAVRLTFPDVPSDVYLAAVLLASPGKLYKIPVPAFVVRIRDRKVSTLDDLKQIACEIPDDMYFDMEVILWGNRLEKVTLKKNEEQFPTEVTRLRLDDRRVRRSDADAGF
ncbi:hypothetical protein BU26DRAFT_611787 [Trematosphaeria pertusa]|uniref:PDZ-like domain-containing protein n=1 Tax=Trematosphaeria pertusa TaxID=390896 RepID=A0A6A6HQZ4_9PLEO|nr:uncharacterized protein BU26DRAFT_611787 [Trematosphaeria pertusa]KAF2240252.1 hypothetical protein BU26DRAFT_611787 [Trematosphaeria pertusa]